MQMFQLSDMPNKTINILKIYIARNRGLKRRFFYMIIDRQSHKHDLVSVAELIYCAPFKARFSKLKE